MKDKDPIVADYAAGTIEVPHLGVTLRVLMGAALASWPVRQPGQRRKFTLNYRGARVGSITVRQHETID